MQAGKLLSRDSLEKVGAGGIKAGSCDRGFLCMIGQGRQNMLFFCTNSYDPMGGEAQSLGKALAKLVSGG